HRDLDGDPLATPDDQEIDVLHGVLDRITLDRLGQGERLRTVHGDVENLVEAAVSDGGGELPGRKRDVLGRLTVPVQDCRHLAGAAGPPGAALAELGAGLGGDLHLGHGLLPWSASEPSAEILCIVTQWSAVPGKAVVAGCSRAP